jgi:hypothetical protein
MCLKRSLASQNTVYKCVPAMLAGAGVLPDGSTTTSFCLIVGLCDHRCLMTG